MQRRAKIPTFAKFAFPPALLPPESVLLLRWICKLPPCRSRNSASGKLDLQSGPAATAPSNLTCCSSSTSRLRLRHADTTAISRSCFTAVIVDNAGQYSASEVPLRSIPPLSRHPLTAVGGQPPRRDTALHTQFSPLGKPISPAIHRVDDSVRYQSGGLKIMPELDYRSRMRTAGEGGLSLVFAS